MLAIAAATFGVPEAITYYVARSESRISRLVVKGILLSLAASLIATLIIVIYRFPLASGDPSIAQGMVVAALAIFPMLTVGVLRSVAAGKQMWGTIAAERGVGSLCKMTAVVGLAWTGNLTVLTATLALAFSSALGGVLYLRVAAESGKRSDQAAIGTGRLLNFGLRVWIGSIAGILLMRVDQLLIVPLADSFQLGIYAVAVSIAELCLLVSSAVRDVAFSSYAKEHDDALLGSAARFSLLASVSIGIIVLATMHLWITPVFGDEFADVSGVAVVLILGVMLATPGSVAGAGLSARGHPGLRSLSLVVACMINLGLLFILVPERGAWGAAVATLVGNLVSSNLNIWSMSRLSSLKMTSFYMVRRADIASTWTLALTMLRRP
jgi:O-antigen/teichoic acid export membrane protein